jgi:preprotein translocase subunit SecF
MGFSFVKPGTNIDFVGKRRIAYVVSGLLLAGSLAFCLFGPGLRLGIDFAGGVVVQVRFQNPVDDEALKAGLSAGALPGLSIQRFGEGDRDYLVRFSLGEVSSRDLREAVVVALKAAFPDNAAEIARLEMVGPKVGADLTNKALEALYYATLLIAVYISGRFEQRWLAAALAGGVYALSLFGLGMGWLVCAALAITVVVCWRLKLDFALGAVVGLLHDVFITLGLLGLMGREIDLNVTAALLTLIGYSLNDTIIVYDRIRENLRVNVKRDLARIINDSLNQTLSRTVLTSGTTFAAVLALFLLGGGVIYDFALTMLMGVVIGTLSSIYIAAPVLLVFGDTERFAAAQAKPVFEKPGEHGVV